MGGLLIITAVVLPSLLWADLTNPFVWMVLVSMLLYGVIGFADDYLKLTRKRSLGLTVKQKMLAQWTVALPSGWAPVSARRYPGVRVPFFKKWTPTWAWYVPWAMLVIVRRPTR
jgi:phospho-N-acetylmuramoyl-pentapeptide-transferase